MTRVLTMLRGFAHFWWEFVVGDDWRIAAGVVVALVATAAVATTSVPAWWLLPVAAAGLLADSLRRAIK
jgi:hypothetical protein